MSESRKMTKEQKKTEKTSPLLRNGKSEEKQKRIDKYKKAQNQKK